MPDEAPTNSAGDGGSARIPTPPWEKAPATSPDETDKAAEIIPPWESVDAPATPAKKLKGLDELFEQRVREAAQEVADDQAQPDETDSPLGVYADLDQAKAPPKEPREPPRREQRERKPAEPHRTGHRGSDRRSERPSSREASAERRDDDDASAPAELQNDTEPTPDFDAPVDERMEAESLSVRPRDGYDLPMAPKGIEQRRGRPEAPSHVADQDVLSSQQQARADQLAQDITQAGPLLAARYGKMRHIGLFQHRLDAPPAPGTKVTIRSERGVELGDVAQPLCGDSCGRSCVTPSRVAEFTVANGPDYPLKRQGKVLRLANSQDLADADELQHVCRQARRFCKEQIDKLNLAMRLTTVEHLLGGERMVFYFTAESRVDFRELVKLLTSQFQTRVEMRQVGARDEARLVGDFERCGRQCCCQTFLKDLKPVSMRMAKIQKATLDPSKISGRCSRLMCCLRYEDAGYQELRQALPPKNIWVRTAEMVGRVVKTHILTQLIELELPDRSQTVIGVEEIVERNVDPPEIPSPTAQRPAPIPLRQRPDRRFLRDAPDQQPPDKQPPDAPVADKDTGDTDKQPPKKRRRRRRPQGQPAAAGAEPSQQRSAPDQSGGKSAGPTGGVPAGPTGGDKRKRRRRRRKR